MNFEIDPLKSKSNKKKHGFDFIDAQALWNDPDLIEIPAKTTDEQRFLVDGKIEGENIIKHIDLSKVRRPNQEQRRVNVDFPLWMIQSLDKEAKRLGAPRQLIIKIWLAERLHKSSTL